MARVQVPVTTLGFVKAAYTTALTGTNNDLVFTAKDGGPGGNEITIVYVVAGTNTALSVTVAGKAITVNVATNGASAATSTSAQVKAAIEGNADASRLVTVAHSGADTGAGVVTALSVQSLAGGALGVAQPSTTASDATNKHYLTGNQGDTVLEVKNNNAGSQTLTFEIAPALAAGLTSAAATQAETITTGATRLLGPFPVAKFNQNASGDVYFTPSVSTDLVMRAYKVTKAA